MTPRWTRRPEGATWGDFGADDERGRLNLLTPEKVRQGVAEVREGLTFCLSLPLDYPGGNVLNPRRHPPQIRPTVRATGRPSYNFPVCEEVPDATDVVSDDLAVLHLQYSTQWDSLAHVGSLFDADGDGRPEPVYYNGFRAGEHVTGPSRPDEAGAPSRARHLGIERLAEAGMQGRGVMIDLRAHLGDARTAVGYDALQHILDADGVAVEPGDMVCLHTGFAERLLGMDRAPDPAVVHGLCAGLDGRDRRLLNWITDCGLAALIADNYAVEVHPALPEAGCCATLPLHEHCLFRLGVNLGELWHLTPLAEWLRARGRHRFLLTAPPLRLPGAVGSPVTPIATV
ncbi:cyclase family protein [Methylobacterium oryzihabitans]|uniref:Cyclase family protein n=1 Tax=Methylobacterium oryzihabitans TaxID=2499852 RepID=A0A3S2XG87_9HYPH|nr:cyclase family protein [Methylobacterium oryzihabitans]RVU14005.1 cyclase family protein [Methylobacterium oryzihabitans]